MKEWKILARHKWVEGATITESVNLKNDNYRKFTATINGYRNWRIFKSDYDNPNDVDTKAIKSKVAEIRDLIDAGNDEIFSKKGYFL